MKRCSKCGEEKEATTEYFEFREDSKDGLRGQCRDCTRKSKRKYYEKNKEHKLEYDKRRRKEKKDHIAKLMKMWSDSHKEHRAIYSRKYQKENKDAIARRRAKYYQGNKVKISEYIANNKERIIARDRAWRAKNMDKCILKAQKRRALKKSLPATLTSKQWEDARQYFHGKCAYCGKTSQLFQDHFYPLSKGGEYARLNIIPACGSCNSSKGSKLFHEWYPGYKFYSKKRESIILRYLNYHKGVQQLALL